MENLKVGDIVRITNKDSKHYGITAVIVEITAGNWYTIELPKELSDIIQHWKFKGEELIRVFRYPALNTDLNLLQHKELMLKELYGKEI